MENGHLWQAFCQTGRIEDYLRYRGVDIYAVGRQTKELSERAAKDRCSGPQREQQYR